MISTTDTIVAIATPRGRGALGMVRLSGGDSIRIASALTDRPQGFVSRYATLCRVRAIDEVVVTAFRSPASFTGEDIVEITAHGSLVVLDAIVSGAVSLGARLAKPGEFTLRAVLHGRRDLVQAEAVADLIDARTGLQARTAFDQLEGTLTARITGIERGLFDLQARLEASLDFPEEGYRFVDAWQVEAELSQALAAVKALLLDGRTGRIVREGATVVLAGRTNAGKSSIFNRLLGRDRSIVAATAGTTRDFVTEQMDLDGILVTLVDTAGLGVAGDVV
ncbi:MAG: GTPase, partial [Armatimonadota bacterium]|nr:GTPase [Armatimonadota bacterium]